jgi:hypothetical protein
MFLASWLSLDKGTLELIVPRLDFAIKLTVLVAAFLGMAYWTYSKQLQQITKQELAKEKQESSDRVLRMQLDIATANSQAQVAIARQKELEAQAEQLRVEQGQIRRQNLELQSQVEREHSARLQIEERLAPRVLSAEQIDRLMEALRPLKGKSVQLASTVGNAEAARYGEQLTFIMQHAGLSVTSSRMAANTRPGVLVCSREEEPQYKDIADQVYAAFLSVGIKAERFLTGVGGNAGSPLILVGPKP